jgi:Ser/Thr protein kinase RdoA (MazF antagonist)
MENRVYEVEIEPEDEKLAAKNPSERFRIVKFYRPGRWSREQILEEHRFLLDLAERDIPAVAPLAVKDGETLLTLPESGIFCAVFPRIGGRSPDELPDDQLAIVGRLLARLHNVGQIREAPNRVRIDPATYGLQSLSFLRSASVLPEQILGRFSATVEEICDITAPWFETVSTQRVHGDCHLGNLLLGKSGFFWVDFDDMLRGPCVQDLWLIIGGRDEEALRKLDILLDA